MRDLPRFHETPSEEELDIKHPFYDLLIKEEKLRPAAEQMKEDIIHVSSKMNSLEDNHPARESLQEEVDAVMGKKFQVDYGLDSIMRVNDELTGKAVDGAPGMGLGAMVATAGVPVTVSAAAALGPLGVLLVGAPVLGIGVASMASGVIVGDEKAGYLDGLINDYLDMASNLHDVREEFDESWKRLVEDQDRDLEPDDYPEG